jgi:hypothetical protein
MVGTEPARAALDDLAPEGMAGRHCECKAHFCVGWDLFVTDSHQWMSAPQSTMTTTSLLLIGILAGVLLARNIEIAQAYIPLVESSCKHFYNSRSISSGIHPIGGRRVIQRAHSFPPVPHLAPRRPHHGVSTTTSTTRRNALFEDDTAGSFSSSLFLSNTSDYPLPTWAVVVVALTLGIGANVWIQQLLSGDRGLGNFLSDGSGFGRSKFQPLSTKDQDRAVSSDPLPWLKLPQLDFVEVAGQQQQQDDSGGGRSRNRQDAVTGSTSRATDDSTSSAGQNQDGDSPSSSFRS